MLQGLGFSVAGVRVYQMFAEEDGEGRRREVGPDGERGDGEGEGQKRGRIQ